MASYYYSTQPFLAWCLNHYFYNREHRIWAAAPFHPHRLLNPRSSNPLRLYEDFYEPWKEADEFSSVLAQKRLKLLSTVQYHETTGTITSSIALRLKNVCNDIDLVFFYPIVYRINVDIIAKNRLIKAGSGLNGSQEYLIESLGESEFDLLFVDLEIENMDNDFYTLRDGSLTQLDALDIFESWIP